MSCIDSRGRRLVVMVTGVVMESVGGVVALGALAAAGAPSAADAAGAADAVPVSGMTRVPENPDVLEGTPGLRPAARRQTYQTQRLAWTWFCRGEA